MMTVTEMTLASPERLEELLKQTETELKEIQPKIDELEKSLLELRELKLVKQRLLTLKMSLSTILENIDKDKVKESSIGFLEEDLGRAEAKLFNFSELSASKSFYPDKALQDVDRILKQRNSLNYEMFKAVVFNGGKATTEEIKRYLVESGLKQPQTGEGFEATPLTEISSRANYLVRKGVLQPLERGAFYSTLGWSDTV
jgi:hypothetical protein